MRLGELAGLTLRDPRAAARDVIDRRWTWDTLWSGLVAVAAVSTILTWILTALAGGSTLFAGPVANQPIVTALVQLGILWLMAQGLWRIGRAFGGHGDAAGAFAVVLWVQAMLTGMQALQLFLLPMPLLSNLLGMAALFLFFWWLVQFTQELHGFDRPWAVLGVAVAAMATAVLILTAVLGTMGLMLPAPPPEAI